MLRYLLPFFLLISGLTYSQTDTLMSVNGTQLFVHTEGKGEPLLIIHGGPGMNQTYLQPWLSKLSKKHTLIYVDLRSMGRSALSIRDSMNLPTFARDLDALRQALGYDHWQVMAHSFGTTTGLYYAQAFPGTVSDLALVSPVPLDRSFDRNMAELMQLRITPEDSIYRTTLLGNGMHTPGLDTMELLMKLSVKLVFCDTARVNRFTIDLPDNYMVASLSYAGFGDLRTRYDLHAIATSANQATRITVFHGPCDIIPLEAAAAIRDDHQVVSLNKCGHYPFIERPGYFLRMVEKAL